MIQIIKTKTKLKSAIKQPVKNRIKLEQLTKNHQVIVRLVRQVGRGPELRIPMNLLQTSTSTTLCPLTLHVAVIVSLSHLWSKVVSGTHRPPSSPRLTKVQAWASRREPTSSPTSAKPLNNSEIARTQGPDSSPSAVFRPPRLRQKKLPKNARFK